MGASKRHQMTRFSDAWADEIWTTVSSAKNGNGFAWKLALAAIAVTGARPAALERGITFSLTTIDGKKHLEATIAGVKLGSTRGQPYHVIRWATENDSHRIEELLEIARATAKAPGQKLKISYDAEAISTRLRELSRKIWPRRKYHISAYCYRELLSSTAKEAGIDGREIAAAMGHRSTESQGAYSRASTKKKGGRRPWTSATPAISIRADRSFIARFKKASAQKKKDWGGKSASKPSR